MCWISLRKASHSVMDPVLSLREEARSSFLRTAGHALGCVYICLWTYLPRPTQCLASTDGWVNEGIQGPGRRLFDLYRRSLCSVETGCLPGLAYKEGLAYLEVDESRLMSSARIPSQRLFYQEAGIKTAVFLGRGGGEIELGVSTATSTDMQERIMNVFSTGFSQQPSLLDLFQNNWSQLSVDEAAAPRPHQVAMISHGRASNPHFPTPMDDDAAMATALLAVISSSLPSSSAGPAPQRAALSSRRMAFSPYDSSRAPIVDPSSCYRGQIMIKRSLAIMRHIASMKAHTMFQESPQSVASQFPHVMSERKRREKLNENFVALRTLISPDTRKDRASILTSARDCMNALREQISCLEEKNRTLEAHLTAPEEPADGAESSGERVEIRVLRSPESSSSQVGQQIELRVTVRVKCDPVGLLLRILGRLKAMGNLSLVSMETRGFSRHGNPFGLAILKFQIEGGEWDEAAFTEAVTTAVDDGMVALR